MPVMKQIGWNKDWIFPKQKKANNWPVAPTMRWNYPKRMRNSVFPRALKAHPSANPAALRGRPDGGVRAYVGIALAFPFAAALVERLYRSGLVVSHIEDGVELGDLQQVVNFLGQVQQFEFAALVAHGGKGADQLTNA
jgi:hypothetical protein